MIRSLDRNLDWTLGNKFLTGKAEIMQDCETRLREWKNDCFFNMNAGIDYLACFDGLDNNKLAIDQIAVINRTNGVVNVANYEQGLTDRKMTTKAAVLTIYGEVEINA